MNKINLETWNRKALYEHFVQFKDPYFGVTVSFDVTKAYRISKEKKLSFFGVYLHACMLAINEVEAFKLRIVDGYPVSFETIHASATIMRSDQTFGFSFIDYNHNLDVFLSNLSAEKHRIEHSKELFPPTNGLDCIHCSAMPWLNFTGHKEPVSGIKDSVPKLAFSKIEYLNDNRIEMKTAITVNHALVDGYHVNIFCEKFQHYLNS